MSGISAKVRSTTGTARISQVGIDVYGQSYIGKAYRGLVSLALNSNFFNFLNILLDYQSG